ncbi:MAG: hypothetical protein ACXWQO_19105 [Bdellovibrionota bacterium]
MAVRIDGKEHLFDCFECAIHALAPECSSCGVKIVGHGVEVDNTIYCSAHCGRLRGEKGFCDHAQGKLDTPQWSF